MSVSQLCTPAPSPLFLWPYPHFPFPLISHGSCSLVPPSAFLSSGPPSLPCQEPRAVPRKGSLAMRDATVLALSRPFPSLLDTWWAQCQKLLVCPSLFPSYSQNSTTGAQRLSLWLEFLKHTRTCIHTCPCCPPKQSRVAFHPAKPFILCPLGPNCTPPLLP